MLKEVEVAVYECNTCGDGKCYEPCIHTTIGEALYPHEINCAMVYNDPRKADYVKPLWEVSKRYKLYEETEEELQKTMRPLSQEEAIVEQALTTEERKGLAWFNNKSNKHDNNT